jgi:RNA polymerase sigma factor (sigma-70 family)
VTDAELYDRWNAGDQRAGGELARRHLPMLRRFVCDRVSDATVAKEVVSATLLQLVKSRASLKDPTHFRAFLLGIARNVLRDHYRKHSRDRLCFVGDEIDLTRHTLDDLGVHPPDPGPDRELVHALHRLPIEDQQILMTYYKEKLSYGEIAEAFELEYGTVASRLHAAKDRLRKALHVLDRGRESSTTTAGDFDDWAREVRHALDHPTMGAPRKVGKWRQVKFEITGIDTFRAVYRKWLQSSQIELLLRRPSPGELRAVDHGPTQVGERSWMLEANQGRDGFGLRFAPSADREISLTHKKASSWDEVIEFARRLDLAAIEQADSRVKDLHGKDLHDEDLRGANLRLANLRGANLRGANLGNADLRGAQLADASFEAAKLRGVDLRGVDPDEWARLDDAELEETIFGEDPRAPFDRDEALLLTFEGPTSAHEALELASTFLALAGNTSTPIVVAPVEHDCLRVGGRLGHRASTRGPTERRVGSGSGRS